MTRRITKARLLRALPILLKLVDGDDDFDVLIVALGMLGYDTLAIHAALRALGEA
jgi:hypothetical protein